MVVTGGVVVGDGHIGKKSINPTLDEFIAAALVGVVMADNDGMVVVTWRQCTFANSFSELY